MLHHLESPTDFHSLWKKFIKYGSTNELRESIGASWRRCRELELDPLQDFPSYEEPQSFLDQKLEKTKDIHQLLQGHHTDLTNIYEILPLAIIYVDNKGNILSLCGHDSIIRKSERTNLKIGSNITEKNAGTTAPAISLMEKQGSFVLAEEHYLQALHWASCFCLPIIDSQHELLGCLDFTTTYEFGKQLKQLTPLFYNIAQSLQFEYIIKNQLELIEFHKAYFQSTFEYTDSILLLINTNGSVSHLNAKAQQCFGLSPRAAAHVSVYELFDFGQYSSLQAVMDSSRYGRNVSLKHADQDTYVMESIPLINHTGQETAYVLKLHKAAPSIGFRPVGGHSPAYSFHDIIGTSDQIKTLINKAKKIAQTPSTILIEGETGTGKELFAQAIHNESRYAQGPFIALNCCAFPDELIESELFGYEKGAYTGAKKEGNSGKFEQANGGTLFLDEIHTMNCSAQQKLLRVLEERQLTRIGGKRPIPLDFRIIAASSKNLATEVKNGGFIEPLFFRINVVRITLPTLQERTEDIESLARHFLQTLNGRFNTHVSEISPEVLKLFSRYPWPGNIRELKNCIESALNYCESDTIKPDDLNETFLASFREQEPVSGHETDHKDHDLEGITKKLMLQSLKTHPTVKDAAQSLGISPSTFYRKKKKFGLSK
jgi:transcriptional regulator with PAS, ATPase and Fis domain